MCSSPSTGLPHSIARQVKWDPKLAHTRVLAITGRTEEKVKDRALESGCEAILAKPVNPVRLEQLLGT